MTGQTATPQTRAVLDVQAATSGPVRGEAGRSEVAATPTRRHGTRTRYVRGPDENDQPGPCRCTPCKQANRDTSNTAYRMKAYGQWAPYVDATAAREHLAMLASVGIMPKRAAQLAGLAPQVVQRIVSGEPWKGVEPSKRIRPTTEAAILAVRPDAALLPAQARVDGTGTRRRLQALVACGWTLGKLAPHVGIGRTNLCLIIRADRVWADTARKVEAAYDLLWNQEPPQVTARDRGTATQSRQRAAAAGWVRPAYWDDDEIDDPKAKPRGVRAKEVAA
jgi:hypothetical protein